MKKIVFGCGLFFLTFLSNAQNGLESIIVEKYYIANIADSLAADVDSFDDNGLAKGTLPVGSVTYRIYADMLPSYKFQALYGNLQSGASPAHDLKILTTTSFYNNPNVAVTTQPGHSKITIKNKVSALDSWLSVGAVCN